MYVGFLSGPGVLTVVDIDNAPSVFEPNADWRAT